MPFKGCLWCWKIAKHTFSDVTLQFKNVSVGRWVLLHYCDCLMLVSCGFLFCFVLFGWGGGGSVFAGNNRKLFAHKERQQVKTGGCEELMGQQNMSVNTEDSCSFSASSWQLSLLFLCLTLTTFKFYRLFIIVNSQRGSPKMNKIVTFKTKLWSFSECNQRNFLFFLFFFYV